MTEHPILLYPEEVRAFLDGRKTQLRRPVKSRFILKHCSVEFDGTEIIVGSSFSEIGRITCPFGQPGDRLWGRETWRFSDWTEDGYPYIEYKEGKERRLIERGIPAEWGERLGQVWADLSVSENYKIDNTATDRVWRSPLTMPRWASRITLEVQNVRVQRVQEISSHKPAQEAPAFDSWNIDDLAAEGPPDQIQLLSNPYKWVEWYGKWWNSRFAKKGFPWQDNPWVWVCEVRCE